MNLKEKSLFHKERWPTSDMMKLSVYVALMEGVSGGSVL